MPDLRILLVHGVGHAEANPQWSQTWQDAIEAALREFGFQGKVGRTARTIPSITV